MSVREVAFLFEDPDGVESVGARLGPMLERYGVELEVVGVPDGVDRVSDADYTLALVVLGPGLARPIAIARHVAPEVGPGHLVFLTEGEDPELEQELASPVLMIGAHRSLADLGSPDLESVLRSALDAARNRARLRTTLDRMNERLAAAPGARVSELPRFTTSQRFLTTVLEEARDAIIATTLDGLVVAFNGAAESTFALPRGEAIGRPVRSLGDGDWPEAVPALIARIHEPGETSIRHEVSCRCRTGERIDLDLTLSRIEDEGVRGVAIIARDVTERNQLEQQLQRARKLEGLGVMAAGIAHDFNNILTRILGHAELAMLSLPAGSPARDDVDDIRMASEQAAALCMRMLAFSGGGRYELARLDPGRFVRDCVREIEVGLDPAIGTALQAKHDLPEVVADEAQLRGALVSLLRNAVEALGEHGGRIGVSVGYERLGRDDLAGTMVSDAAPGSYVEITIEDDGPGMDEATLESAFDPFFSTRFTGRGLGLPAALGVVRAHGGTLSVASTPGVGTRVRVWLPADDDSDGRGSAGVLGAEHEDVS